MRLLTTDWTRASLVVVSLLLGFVAGNYWQVPRSASALAPESEEGRITDYEDAYVNAVAFRDCLRKQPTLDSLFAQEPFLKQAVRILRQDSARVEALAMPHPKGEGNYYLIRGDSITQLQVSPRKVR
jgi:hypothetical protein